MTQEIKDKVDLYSAEFEAFLNVAIENGPKTSRESVVAMLGRSIFLVFDLNAERARLEKALDFYANEKNWTSLEPTPFRAYYYLDRGEKAREALNPSTTTKPTQEKGETK